MRPDLVPTSEIAALEDRSYRGTGRPNRMQIEGYMASLIILRFHPTVEKVGFPTKLFINWIHQGH